MNPIDSYRDSALDVLVAPPHSVPAPTSERKSSRHSRQASMLTREPLPPTSSSRQPIYSNAEVQRSFSQRARGRPYAEEAYANDSLADYDTVQPLSKDATSSVPSQGLGSQSAPEADLILPSTDRRTSRRQQIIQDNIQHAANAANATRASNERRSDPVVESIDTDLRGLAPAPTMKDATTSEQREWAPDRSPLQKLEVTLNDISKEEKRARVQEAEMLHREKTRSNKAAARTELVASRAQPGPSTIEDVGLSRNLSNTHKDRLHHSTIIESRKPDPAVLSSSNHGFNYSSAFPPSRSFTITRRSRQGADIIPSSTSQRTASSTYAQDLTSAPSQPRSVSATQPRTSVSGILPSQDPKASRSRQIYDTDRIPTSQERNASHRAALERLTGDTSSKGKHDSHARQAQLSSANNQFAGVGETLSTRTANSHALAARTSTPQGQTVPLGQGVQDSPGLRSVDSPAPIESSFNPMQKQKRKSSVSFKEPYEKRRPVDEWKAAEIARLTEADFLLEPNTDPNQNKAWWEDDPKTRRRSNRQKPATSVSDDVIDDRVAEFRPKLFVKCGPLLRYTGMKRTVGAGAQEYWRGTMIMVTQDSQSSYERAPILRLYSQPKSLYTHSVTRNDPHDEDDDHPHEEHDPIAGTTKISRIGRALYVRPANSLPSGRDISAVETDDGPFESSPPITNTNEQAVSVAPVVTRIAANNGEKYGRYREVKGVRLYTDPDRDVTFWLFKMEIQLGIEQQHIGYRINGGAASGFWVPATGQTMHMMFHSCNGFSMSVKTEEFSGPDPLWRNVLNAHQSRPFHVMIGGGDQIYNDKVMRDTRHFADWTANKNPHYKHNAAFTSEMKEELETFYLENYCNWFSQGLFGVAGSQIPMVNMWDDHDIIDGFGSYPHHFMLSPVFSGLGNIAFKYYMLFQQHSVAAMTTADEPSWLLGYKKGPYVNQLSRSIFLDLGKHVAFLALDCRTERTKSQVLSLDSLDLALERCRKEIVEGVTKHLIVLLGVPIAYPRMNWLENILTSPAMEPVKALGRYGVIKGGFLNRFDGGVEVLDDLDDHWTAHHHKKERNEFVKDLQDLAAERSVRITILGGDVHLAAIGQFYSNPKLKIPKDRDHRYMPNVVSSAIVNTPPPEMLADVLNKRNKVHHLDSYTDESMIPMFTHDVDFKKRNNKHLLPRRNWCSITEYIPGRTPPSSRSTSPSRSPSPEMKQYPDSSQPKRSSSLSRNDLNPRTLLRRLSSRGKPPTAYREEYDNSTNEPRASSFDEGRTGRSGPTSWNEKLGLTRRTASETRDTTSYREDANDEGMTGRKPPPFRPGFHRRPTNLSEKAAKKGNVPAVDAEGKEFDVNDHVNLDGGLDIVLNCEIDRKDPRGSTLPYRLLVPALWYDGSSDREKLDGGEGLQRKPTLMNKLGFRGRRGQGAAQNQGAGNWGQDESDTGSYSESDHETEERPKKSLGFFGSLRKKHRADEDPYDRDESDHYGAAAGVVPEAHDYNTGNTTSFHEQVTAASTTTPKATPPRVNHAAFEDPNLSDQNRASFNTPPNQVAPPKRSSSFKASNLLRKNSSKKRSPVIGDQFDNTKASPYFQPDIRPSQQIPGHSHPSIAHSNPGLQRENSYTIGTNRGTGARHPHTGAIDADSAYLATQRKDAARAVSNPSTAPTSYATQPGNDLQRNSSLRSNNTGLSKQEQVLGIGTDHDAFSGKPQQRSLRGNGILGRFGLGKQSASADRVPQVQSHISSEQATGRGRDEFGMPPRTASQGYSGIEAYREKPKRGLSMRDRARDFLDRVDGRRRYDDDYDDDDYSYHSSESHSSENLGEQPAGADHRYNRLEHQNQQRDSQGPPSKQRYQQEGIHRRHDNDAEFDDERSWMSGETGEPLPPERPKRGLSQRLKMGMMRMGSSSKRNASGSNAGPDQRTSGEHAAPVPGEPKYY